MKKILVISTSLRSDSNSHALAESFAEGARSSGHDVELISLRNKDLKFCIGCLSCVNTGRCVLHDDANHIVNLMHDADVIALATPIYYYGMAGQMKTLLDRANPLYDGDYHFTDIYLLTAAAEDEPEVPVRTVTSLEGWIECFDRARLAGVIFAGGVNAPGEIQGHKALAQAYQTAAEI